MIKPDKFPLAAAILGFVVVPAVVIGGGNEGSVAGSSGGGFFEDRVETVTSSHVLIGYEVVPSREPVTKVELWYTKNQGKSWAAAAQVKPDVNPIVFDAPSDGVYGFFLVLHNARASTRMPASGVAAHRWVRVDRSAPQVQVRSIQSDDRFDLNRELHIRWSASDDGLIDRPVSLHYRSEQTKMFVPIASDLPGAGSYRWTVPEEVEGDLEIKVTATDRAGHRGQSLAEGVKVARASAVPGDDATPEAASRADRRGPAGVAGPGQAAAVDTVLGGAPIHDEPDAGGAEALSVAASEAKRLYDLGTWERLRGEHEVAVVRYREALRQYPGFLAARSDLAGLLVLRGALEEAETEFKVVLEADSQHRPALKGLALVQARRREYRSAHQTLQKLLLLEPKDAESWLNFGDVCMFMGDRSAARAAWAKSGELAAEMPRVKERAGSRLEIYGAEGPGGGRRPR